MSIKVLNLGCGYNKIKNAINVDIDPRCRPDKIVNLEEKLPFENESFDYVHASQVLEHIFHWEKLLMDIHRVLKLGGTCYIGVPLFPGKNAVYGHGHVRFFLPENLLVYTDPRYFQPKCWTCDEQGSFAVQDISLDDGKNNNGMASLEVVFTKVDRQYWMDKAVNMGLKVQVYGCFWCSHELEIVDKDTKRCPNCSSYYNFETEIIKRDAL